MSISGYSWVGSRPRVAGPSILPELLGEELQLAKVQMLVGKPQHAVSAEGQQDLADTAFAQRTSQIDAA
jgi:hypothetical protein